jgi:hypothetical protein
MSDLQDLIATNAVKAYNEGFERGTVAERERVIELLKLNQVDTSKTAMSPSTQVAWNEIRLLLAELIKGNQK